MASAKTHLHDFHERAAAFHKAMAEHHAALAGCMKAVQSEPAHSVAAAIAKCASEHAAMGEFHAKCMAECSKLPETDLEKADIARLEKALDVLGDLPAGPRVSAIAPVNPSAVKAVRRAGQPGEVQLPETTQNLIKTLFVE